MKEKQRMLKEFKDLGFEIEENIHYVTEVNDVVLDDISFDEFEDGLYRTDSSFLNYDNTETTYSILKDNHPIYGYESVTAQDVVEFIINKEYENIE